MNFFKRKPKVRVTLAGDIRTFHAYKNELGWWADVFGKPTRLLPNGKVDGECYVKSWTPLDKHALTMYNGEEDYVKFNGD